jgi:chromosome segregation ATPase
MAAQPTARELIAGLTATLNEFIANQRERDRATEERQRERHRVADESWGKINSALTKIQVDQGGIMRDTAHATQRLVDLTERIEIIEAIAAKAPKALEEIADLKPKVDRLEKSRIESKVDRRHLGWLWEMLRFLAALGAGLAGGHFIGGSTPR